MNPETLSRFPPVVAGPLFGLLFFWIAMALGFRLSRWLEVPRSRLTPWEYGFTCVTLGTASLQVVPCALGAVGLMTRLGLQVAGALLSIALARDILHVGRAVLRGAKRLSGMRPPTAVATWSVLFMVALGIVLIRTLVPGSMGDDDGYHLASPKRWLSTGSLDYLPTYTHTNASLGFEMLYAIALSFTDVIGAKILHYGAGVFVLLGVVLCARRLGNTTGGVVVASLLLFPGTPLSIDGVMGAAFVDLGACWMAVASVLLWLVWREEKHRTLILCMALFAGFAGSFKFTSLAVSLAWGPVLFYDSRHAGASWRQCTALVLRFGMISAIPVAPWFIRNAFVTGNPVYPLFSTFFRTRDWSSAQAAVFGKYIHYYAWGIKEGARLSELQRKEIVVATVLTIGLAGMVTGTVVRRQVLRSLLGFAVLFAVVTVSLTGLYYRYWLPATIVICLVLVVSTTQRWSSTPWCYWASSALVLVGVVRILRYEGREAFVSSARVASGLRSFSAEHATDGAWNMWRYINSQTPTDARVMAAAFYTSMGASSFGGVWVDRTFFTTDSHLQGVIRLQNWQEFVESVEKLKITHMLIFDKQYDPNRYGFSFLAQRNEYPFCRRLADEYGQKLFQGGNLQLYRVFPERARIDGERERASSPVP